MVEAVCLQLPSLKEAFGDWFRNFTSVEGVKVANLQGGYDFIEVPRDESSEVVIDLLEVVCLIP